MDRRNEDNQFDVVGAAGSNHLAKCFQPLLAATEAAFGARCRKRTPDPPGEQVALGRLCRRELGHEPILSRWWWFPFQPQPQQGPGIVCGLRAQEVSAMI